MKILHLIPDLGKGGAEKLALETCIEQQEQGLNAKLAYFKNIVEYEDLAEAAMAIHRPAVFVPSIFGKATRALSSLEHLMGEFEPDLIHTHRYVAEIVRTELTLLPSAGYLTHLHDRMPALKKPNLRSFTSKKGITRAWERNRLLKRYVTCGNHFLAISSHIRDYFVQNLPSVWHPKIHLMPNAVNLSPFTSIRAQYKEGEPIRLINVGRMVKSKGQRYLLEAMKELVDKGLDVHLQLVGNGPERHPLEAQAQTLGITERVEFLGHREDIPELLAQSHLMVHSATDEPFGLVLIEALASGVPVVVADGGGPKDILQAANCGILVEPKSGSALAEGVQQAISSQEYWEALSVSGKVRAEQYAIGPYVTRLTGLYEQIIREKRGG